MRASLLIAAVGLLAGCSVLPTNRASGIAEGAWQAMNVIDTGQTMHIAKSRRTDAQMAAWAARDFTAERYCYEEANFLTRAVIGKHPSSGEAAAMGLAWAWGHARVTSWLDDRTERAFDRESPSRGAWYVGRIAWHGVSLVTKAWQINRNNNIGLKPFASGCKE